MSIWRLVLREIQHRKLNFGLGLLSVGVAIACLTGAWTLLQAHDLRTEWIIAAREAATREEMRMMQDDYRKIMKKLGFNLLILPKDQNLGDLYAENFAAKYMPEAYVDSLARSGTMTIRHLLPSLQQKLTWPEQRRTVVLTGVRGEVPLEHVAPKEPMLLAVPPGTAVLGYELHRSLELQKGDPVALLGRRFTVSQCNPERGNKDDITIWIDLREAQELLGRQGQINGILALKCHCAGNELSQVRAEVAGLLPDTQVIEFDSKVITRAEARDRAAATARRALAAEKEQRAQLRAEGEAFAAVLVPLALVVSGAWVGFLFLGNVRERRAEIGLWRALGMGSRAILSIFLSKALLLGLAGGLLGYGAGFAIGVLWGEEGTQGAAQLFDPRLILLAVGLAGLLAVLASWLPAMAAARQDPAAVLVEE